MTQNSVITGLITLSLLVPGGAVAHAGGNGKMLRVGEPFVDFELEAHDGTTVSGADVLGRPYLLFFYPKASTPG
jgi:cytochrome oxidase Cu insertion factor (SCO1/SenC/PrrC family)